MGGYLLSSDTYKPGRLMLHSASVRIVPIATQLVIIHCWGHEAVTDSWNDCIMFYLSILSLCVANFTAGLITIATFSSMMKLSQSASPSIQTSHYSLLATMEVIIVRSLYFQDTCLH